MVLYCVKCKAAHNENEICPHITKQLKERPELLDEAAQFANIAGQYHLITSQSLNSVTKTVNNLVGTNLSYEGTHQYVRDIQVFKNLNIDSFSKSNVFSNAQSAKEYLLNATDGQKGYLLKRLNGTGQEIDWLRWKQGQLSSLWEKSELLGGNMPGIDGQTINRFTGKTVSQTTIKAAQGQTGINTNVKDVAEAIQKGTADSNTKIFGVKGTEEATRKVGLNNSVKEMNTTSDTKESTDRLFEKIKNGQAHTTVTLQEASKKMCQGAIIGAAVGLTISSITNYIKYKNGEITQEEAFREVAQDTTKGILTGGSLAGVTLFLPGGAIGFVAGVAVGIYVNTLCTNVLDEIFGKGAFQEILTSSGHSMGMTMSLHKCIEQIKRDELQLYIQNRAVSRFKKNINQLQEEFDQLMED